MELLTPVDPVCSLQRPKKSVFGGSLEPSASVRLAPASPDEAAAVEALPAAAIASPAVARVVGLYRMLLAEGLAEGRTEVRWLGAAFCPGRVWRRGVQACAAPGAGSQVGREDLIQCLLL